MSYKSNLRAFSTNRYMNKNKASDSSITQEPVQKQPNNKQSNQVEPEKEKSPSIGIGIKNDIGEQNCYVNVIIQMIYHNKYLKEFFLTEEFEYKANLTLLQELKFLVEKYANREKDNMLSLREDTNILDPFELRVELSKLFREEKKFNVNEMEDPAEFLFVILNAIHSYSINLSSLKYTSEKPCIPECISHKYFWINLLEQEECECGATSEILQYDFNNFIYEIYINEVQSNMPSEPERFKSALFYIKKNLLAKSKKLCPTLKEKCPLNKVRKNIILNNSPSSLVLNLVWEETEPKMETICKTFALIPLKIKSSDLFQVYDINNQISYELTGLVCYWGRHYICIMKRKDKLDTYWVHYDDTILTKMSSWKEVIQRCLRSHFHPTLLIYSKFDDFKDEIPNKDIVTDKELISLLKYAQSFDIENNKKYKNYQISNTRLRPENKALSKPGNSVNFERIIKNREPNGNNLRKSNVGMTNVNNRDENEIDKQKNEISNETESVKIDENYKKELIENISKSKNSSKDQPYGIGEDTWICEWASCRNINPFTTYKCLRCEKFNEVMFELHYQKKNYSQEYSKICERSRSAQPQKKPNTSVDLMIKCKICGFTNLKNKEKCEECSNLLKEKEQVNLHNRINKNDELTFKSTRNERETHKIKENYIQPKEIWTCQKCRKINHSNLKYCSYCFHDNLKVEPKKYTYLTESYMHSGYPLNNSVLLRNDSRKDSRNEEILTKSMNFKKNNESTARFNYNQVKGRPVNENYIGLGALNISKIKNESSFNNRASLTLNKPNYSREGGPTLIRRNNK